MGSAGSAGGRNGDVVLQRGRQPPHQVLQDNAEQARLLLDHLQELDLLVVGEGIASAEEQVAAPWITPTAPRSPWAITATVASSGSTSGGACRR